MTLQQDDEQNPKRLMEEVPQEFITADDPREGGQEEDVPDEDERGDPDRRVGQPIELEDKPR